MRKLGMFLVTGMLAAALAACGGSTAAVQNPPPPPPPAKPATTAGAQFGHLGLGVTTVAATTTAQLEQRGLFSRLMNAIDPKVYAAGTATISGSYSGQCASIPNPFTAGNFIPIYQFGNSTSQSCQLEEAGPQAEGPGVIGAGTLSTLVAFGKGSATATQTSGKIVIAVNGIATGITCDIGQGTRCEDTIDTAAVNDGDKISAYLVSDGATTWTNVSVIVLKQ